MKIINDFEQNIIDAIHRARVEGRPQYAVAQFNEAVVDVNDPDADAAAMTALPAEAMADDVIIRPSDDQYDCPDDDMLEYVVTVDPVNRPSSTPHKKRSVKRSVNRPSSTPHEKWFKQHVKRMEAEASRISKALAPVFGKEVPVTWIPDIDYSKYRNNVTSPKLYNEFPGLVVKDGDHWVQFTVGRKRRSFGAKNPSHVLIGWDPALGYKFLVDRPITKTVYNRVGMDTEIPELDRRRMSDVVIKRGTPAHSFMKRNSWGTGVKVVHAMKKNGEIRRLYDGRWFIVFPKGNTYAILYNDVRNLKQDTGIIDLPGSTGKVRY